MSEAEIAQFISSYIFLHPLTAGQRHSNVFKLACEACRRHYPQESILRELTAFFEHTDFRPEELTSVLSSGYKQVNEHAPASSTATSSSFQKDIRTKIPYGTIKIPMPTMKPISWERNSRKELLYFPEIRTIILPYCRMIVLLKAKANANKISLFFPSTVLSLNNPDNIRNFVQELTKHFMTDKTIQVGAKHDFNIRKVTRLQNHLT